LIYSISASVISKVVTGFLNKIYYENILERESYEKYNFMNKNLKRKIGISMFVYSYRCKNALSKVKILNAFEKVYLKTRRKLEILKNKKSKDKDVKSSKIISKMDLKSVNHDSTILDHETSLQFLIQHHNNYNDLKIDINEFFLPKPYYDENLYKIETEEKYSLEQKYQIFRTFSYLFPRMKKIKRKTMRKFIFSISEYSYKLNVGFRTIKTSKISFQILNAECLNEEAKSKRRRSSIKSILFGLIVFSSYIFLFIMVTDIYNKYEDNIFTICISPLLTVLFSKFLITQNLMIFVHSFFMYQFGEKIYSDNRKNLNPLGIIFRFVIPAISKSNHKSLLLFRDLCNKQK